jgi:MoaA/NifB/PqqE/SkfB family radical SAM enzyme
VQSVAHGELSGVVHQSFQGKRAPLEVSIEVTRRCPLECLHCYNNLPMSDHAVRSQELTLEEHCRLRDELVGAGCLWLLYTGGQISVCKDFLEIYTEANKRGFLTKGIRFTLEFLDRVARAVPCSIFKFVPDESAVEAICRAGV